MKRFLLIAAFTLCWTPVSAQTLYVPSGEHSSIQSAIDNANNGDSIVVSAGTYQENINFLGKAITVRSVDPNDPNVVAATIIDGSNPVDPNVGSVVTFNSGEDANSVLSGFTITGGTGSWLWVYWQYKGYQWNRCGGAILCSNYSSPTIRKNIITANIAGQGAGIYCYNHSDATISDNIISDNNAIVNHGFVDPDANDPNIYDHGDGGAIVGFQYCDLVIKNNIIQNNHADFYGGGIHLRQWSNGLIEDNDIISNHSKLGAGIHITYTSSPNIVDNLIRANITDTLYDLGGGGIYVIQYSCPFIEHNVITENQSNSGAGICVAGDGCSATICNNMIVNNVKGAGIRVKGRSIPIITNNTIVGNTASVFTGGGIDCLADFVPVIENNIIASNGNSYGIYASTTPPVIRYNNVWDNGAGNYNSVIGDRTGINGNISIDPNFVTGSYHLLPISGCIDVGDNLSVPPESATDIDGEERIFNDTVDMGADEVVTNLADFNTDGIVGYFDLKVMANEWLGSGSELQSDLFDDDFIDFADYALFAEQWLWTAAWRQ
jgi:hypothetical protein